MTRFSFVKKILVLALSTVALSSGHVHAATITKSQAAEIAQAKYGGKLFGKIKKTESANGEVVYEVRLDDKGRVIIVLVSGSGHILTKK